MIYSLFDLNVIDLSQIFENIILSQEQLLINFCIIYLFVNSPNETWSPLCSFVAQEFIAFLN